MAKNDDGADDRPDGYVGYKHPPKQHRFAKGNKANPHGRKGKPRAGGFLDERQRVMLDGKWRWRTRRQMMELALYRTVMADGNVSAAKLVDAWDRDRKAEQAAAAGVKEDRLSPDEQAALLRAAARQVRRDGPPSGEDEEPGSEDGS